jgi:hypothetical protein
MRIYKTFKKHPIVCVVGFIITIIGFSGIPDDIATWGKWVGQMSEMINHQIVRTWLVIVGTMILLAINIAPWLLKKEKIENASELPLPQYVRTVMPVEQKRVSEVNNQKHLSPLEIEFDGEECQETIWPIIDRLRQYYCYIINPNNRSVKSVRVDLILNNKDYRLMFCNGKTDIAFSNHLRERVNLFQCSTVRPIDEFIAIKHAYGELRLDLKDKHNFDIKVSGVGVTPIIKSFEITVVRGIGTFDFPYLKIQEAINA